MFCLIQVTVSTACIWCPQRTGDGIRIPESGGTEVVRFPARAASVLYLQPTRDPLLKMFYYHI